MKTMTKLFAVAVFILLGSYSIHAQSLEWVRSVGSESDNDIGCVVVDDEGNVYTTGIFRDSIDIDPGPGIVNLTDKEWGAFFVQKLDASGNLVWAKSMCGRRLDDHGWGMGQDIAIDAHSNVYVTGVFCRTVDFDPGDETANLTSRDGRLCGDVFVLKLDSIGNFVWVKSIGGSGYDEGKFIEVDTENNVYVAGSFQDTVDFDPGPDTAEKTAGEFSDIFIQKLDASGSLQWVKTMGTIDDSQLVQSLGLDGNGNVYTAGQISGEIDFDPGDSTYIVNASETGVLFIHKLDASGNFVWVKNFGLAGNYLGSMVIDSIRGHIYTSGGYYFTIDLDPGDGVFNLTNPRVGDFEVFVQKLDLEGNFISGQAIIGVSQIYRVSTVVDDYGNLYTSGSFQSTADFDPGNETFNLTSAGDNDIFVQKLDPSGNLVWARSMGGRGSDWPTDIAVSKEGCAYTVGIFHNTADFKHGSTLTQLVSVGGKDIFIQKSCQPIVGLRETTFVSGMSIYPNPVTEFLYFELGDSGDILNSIEIVDLSGKVLMKQESFASSVVEVNLSWLTPGMYYAQAKSGDQTTAWKFIKQ